MEFGEVFSIAQVRFSLSLLHLLDESQAGRLESIARSCVLPIEEAILAANGALSSFSGER